MTGTIIYTARIPPGTSVRSSSHSLKFPDSSSDFNSFKFPGDSSDFNPSNLFEDAFGSFKLAATAAFVSGVVGMVALVVIVFAIIDCLKKAGNAIPRYARIATGDSMEVSKAPASTTTNLDVAVTIPPVYSVITDSQVEAATMERFLSNMAREKPIWFSPQQLEGFTSGYSTELGSGGFGVVYKGEFPNGVQVAIKVIKGSTGKRIEEQFMAEVSTIGRTYHINLVRLYGFCFDPTRTALVYEYMENGSLDKFLFDENQPLDWGKLHEIAIGTAKGIAYLHEECQQRIIHYDIKPGNVLIDASFTPKVADFGLAKLYNRESIHVAVTGFKGTPGYAAPELYKPFPVTHKCDVYSFGMLLFEIVGRRRNHDINLSETQEWLPRWTWEKFQKGELEEMVTLFGIAEKDKEKAERMCMVALWCVQYLPETRPLMSTVVKMLEGGEEIIPPPNPFQYLESSGRDFAVPSGSSQISSSAASTRKTSQASYSTPMMRTFEIQIAS